MFVPSLITLTISFLVIGMVKTHSSQSLRSGFDQPCNKTMKCKSQSWLTCDNETAKCKCAKSDEMIYDYIREKCVAVIGERCKFGFDEDGGTAAWYERAECVKGSVCGPSGICSCPDGFYEDLDNNQCSIVKDNGQSCQTKYECNQEKFLNCIQGKCRCDPDSAVYNSEAFNGPTGPNNNYYQQPVASGICIGRIGTRCSKTSSPRNYCVRNAYCSDEGTCRCTQTYGETSERLCGLGYDQSCSSNNVCSDKLRCSGYKLVNSIQTTVKCQCPDPDYQIYDPTKTTCKGRIGAACDPNDKMSCIDKASCVERDNIFQCECEEGFVDTATGNCQIGFGSVCNYIDRGTATNTNTCDDLAKLQCKGGKCSCENDADIYEPDQRKCLSPVGLRCNDTAQCVSNAECIKGNSNFWGRCACKDGLAVTKSHTCILPVKAEDSNEDSIFDTIDYSGAFENSTEKH